MERTTETENLFRALTGGMLIGCVMLSIAALVDKLIPVWNGSLVTVLCGVAAVEAYASYRLTHRGTVARDGLWRVRLGEIAAAVILIQLYVDLAENHAPFVDGVPWINRQAVGIAVPVLLAWLVAGHVASLYATLDEPPDHSSRLPPAIRLLSVRFFGAGLLLFAVAGLTQPKIAGTIHLPHAAEGGPVLNVLLYFLLGTLTLGYLQYATLRQRWRAQKISIAGGLSRHWLGYCLLFVGIASLVALLLPTGHVFGVLDQGRVIWDQIVSIFRGPLTGLLTVLGKTARPPRPTVLPSNLHGPPPVHHPHPPSHRGGSSVDWLALVKSLIFWSVALLAVSALVRGYLRRRPAKKSRSTLKLGGIGAAIGRLWQAIRRRLLGYAGVVADHLPRRVRTHPMGALPTGRILRFTRGGERTPRERVLRAYLAVVHQAQRQGLARGRSETPHEFGSVLTGVLPEAHGELASLTEAFVEARYSRHDVPAEVGDEALRNRRRVRQALRGVTRERRR